MDVDEVNEFVSMLAKGYTDHLSSVLVYPFDDDLEPVNPLSLRPRLLASKAVKRRISQVRCMCSVPVCVLCGQK